jgi:hypothetical protein
VSERRDQTAGKRAAGAVEEQSPPPQDLSVTMWVWTLLGFALVVAVIIVVIIWGGGQPRQTGPATEGQPEMTSTTEPTEAETTPSEAANTAATQPG